MNAAFEYKKTIDKNKEVTRFVNHFEALENDRRRMNSIRLNNKHMLTMPVLPREPTKINSEYAFDFKYTNEETLDVFDNYKINVKRICNVYQTEYRDGKFPTGFGDFIRGCYFLMDFCDRYNVQFDYAINHPISKCLKWKRSIQVNKSIVFFTDNNCLAHIVRDDQTIHTETGEIDGKFKKFLAKKSLTYNGAAYIYNIVYPSHKISARHKAYMRTLLTPSIEMSRLVDAVLHKFGVAPRAYNVVQLRSGDDNSGFVIDETYIKSVCREIDQEIPTILIADNNDVKRQIVNRLPKLHAIYEPITHLGEGVVQEDERVKNTMVDFYLMANALSILSLTCYEHGSGFSQWCAETYNIPYVCKLVRPIAT
jgi:hypothetical protein